MTTWAVALALLFAGLSQAAPIKTEHAEVELIAEKTALVVGEKNTIGLSIKHAPHWHTYWKNPGDSGYPTKITWQVPAGYGVGDFDWPTPKRLAAASKNSTSKRRISAKSKRSACAQRVRSPAGRLGLLPA